VFGRKRARALVVIAAAAIAVAVAATGAFGAGTAGHSTRSTSKAVASPHFQSSPTQGQFGHLKSTIHARSGAPCPAGDTAEVKLVQGTTTYASAQVTADSKGGWSVFMTIPSNLLPGKYAVTANCFPPTPGPIILSYKPNNFRVVAPICPAQGTTTTVRCRVPATTSTT
jgi:hypothetical protein